MFSPYLQYLDEAHRKQWIDGLHRQAQFDQMRKENLEDQLTTRLQDAEQDPLEKRSRSPLGVLKAVFSPLSGHKNAPTFR